tara:strand:+ start:364 stop:906 length:543 start_codon:yes stop_codon:yes gene_type:complete
MNIRIDFGGFYGSTHEAMIDNLIEYYGDDEDEDYIKQDINLFDYVDYQKTFDNYIKSYCSILRDHIFYEYDIDIEYKNISLKSPKFYNFETDVIYCSTLKKDQLKLNKKLLRDQDFIDYLKKSTKSYDGYMSFYSFDEAVSDKDNILHQFVYTFICSKFDDYSDIEFDLEYTNEDIFITA